LGRCPRLDFTAIGPAGNAAARLEALTKELGRLALFSGAFARSAKSPPSLNLASIRLKQLHLSESPAGDTWQ
jgi:class 3 adenylate cyclase